MSTSSTSAANIQTTSSSQQPHLGSPVRSTIIASAASAPAPLEPSSTQVASSSSPGPSISLTPATPITAVDNTAHPSSPEMATSAPVAESSKAATALPVISEKSPAVAPTASSSKPTPSTSATPATSKPTASAMKLTTQKKKRRRKGFAGFLLSMGCLSASEFEDDPKEVKKREAAAKKTSTVAEVKPVTATTAVPVIKEKQGETSKAGESKVGTKTAVGAGIAAGTAAGVGAGVVGAGMDKREKEAVIVPPVEPVSPPLDETAGMTSSAVQPPGSGSELLQTTPSRQAVLRRESETGTPSAEQTSSGGYTEMLQTEGTDSQDQDENVDAEGEDEYAEEEYEDEEDRLIAQGGIGIPLDENGRPNPLLPPISKEHTGRKCLVLDLDETLLHSSFKMLPSADYIVPVEIESQTHNVYVIKRPGVDHFLTEMGKIYEVVVFTASLSKYADPVLDMLDPDGVVKHRLFRESCYNHKGNYVKDLSQLGRTMETCIILDNSPASYIFHPNNAVPVSTWFNDPHDTELTDLCPFLTDLATVDDIRGVLDGTL